MKKNNLVTALMGLIGFAMLMDFVLLISSPWWLKLAYDEGYKSILPIYERGYYNGGPSGKYAIMLVFIIFCGAVIFFALSEGLKILYNIRKGEPFCIDNSKGFFRAAIYAFIITVAFMIKMLFSASFLTVICACFLFAGGLLLLVLSELFKLAAKIKEENELTI